MKHIRYNAFSYSRLTALGFAAVASLHLAGCGGLGIATGAAAATGIAAAQEGGIRGAVSDSVIKLRINEAWLRYDLETFAKLSTEVNQGRVLLTGVVQDPADRVEAVRLAWNVGGVQQVINEIRVADSEGVRGYVSDTWISSRLRTELTFNRDIQSINYSIDTVQGIVYLMGVAQNQRELNRVIEAARTIPGVKQVVSYVKLAGEPLEGEARNTGRNNASSQAMQAAPAPNTSVRREPVPAQTIYDRNNDESWQGDNEPASPSIADEYYR